LNFILNFEKKQDEGEPAPPPEDGTSFKPQFELIEFIKSKLAEIDEAN